MWFKLFSALNAFLKCFPVPAQTLKTVHGKSCMNLVLKCCTSCEYLMLGISVDRSVEIRPPPPPPPPPPSRFKEQAPSANESNRSLKVFGRTSGLARNWPLFFSQTGRITASLVTGWAQQLCSCKSRYGQEWVDIWNMLSSQGKLITSYLCR